ncbi:hypothetical protein OAP56_02515 [Rickettsiaceae bacterium]|nr:hypothetical protein [Rickettsiaceae bacterium]
MYLSHTQLKAARSALNLGVRDIGLLIQASRTTVSKLEHNKINISDMRLAERRNIILLEFFKKNKITFPSHCSIEFSCPNNDESAGSLSKDFITRFQLRVSRVILKKTQDDLAKVLSTSPSLIKKSESESNQFFFTQSNLKITAGLLSLFKKEGLEFPAPFLVSFSKL